MMTTPQKKSWRFSLTPRSDKPIFSSSADPRIGVGEEKGAAVLEASLTPASGAAYANGVSTAGEDGDQESLVERVSKLENELFEYQYNMGLLLLEKKEWTSKYEDLQKDLTETKDALKREQASHLIAMSDIEKREENLRKALGVEKQCYSDLEKDLHEMRAEYARIKFTADSKLAEANALAIRIEDKSLEVEAKLREADAKHAEASRKSSDIERKKQDLDARESALKRARISFDSERETHESTLSKQREDLREWEKKLQEGEERLYEAQKILNQREERVNEVDKRYKRKEQDLEDAQKKIDVGNKELKRLEDEIASKIKSLKDREKEYDITRQRTEKKEAELHAWEEKLIEREHKELQKLLDEHKSELDVKKRMFDLELDQRRDALDEELRSKIVSVEKREAEISHMEEKITKREVTLEKKLEKLKQKESDLDVKSKALKAEEKSIKSQEKSLDAERKIVLCEKENALSLKADLERKEVDLEEKLCKILAEQEQLKVTEEERSNYTRLQSELKQEIEKCRRQKEELMQEADSLRQERESFEREWEVLDEKKAEIERELKNINEEKEKLEKWRQGEEERLRNDTSAMETNIQREMEALRLAKECFAAEMEHEKSLLSEKAYSERSQMLNDIELRKRELEIEMQKKMEGMELSFREKETSFNEEKEKELNNINYLREVVGKGMDDLKEERRRVEKQEEEVEKNRRDLEQQRFEIQKDIDQLVILSGKLKDQRERFLEEREHFIAFVEKHDGCEKCGEITREFVVCNLQCLHDTEVVPLPKVAEDYNRGGDRGLLKNESSPAVDELGTPNSAGKMSSWMRKCTQKIFFFSATKKNERIPMQNLESEVSTEEPENVEVASTVDVQGLIPGVADDSIREEVDGGQDRGESNINDEKQGTSVHSGLNSQPKAVKKRGGPRMNRTRTMMQVVKDAEGILGNDVAQTESDHPIGGAEESSHQEDSSLAGRENGRNGRKRTRAQTSRTATSLQDGDESGGNSDGNVGGRLPKRRQKAARAVEPPAGKRYNLRGQRNAAKGATAGVSSGNARRPKSGRTQSVDVVSGIGESTDLVQGEVEAAGETSIGKFTAAATQIGTYVASEEVSGTPDRHDRYSNVTPVGVAENSIREGGGDDEDEEEDETQRPGEVSIGKKLWTFFTT